MTKHITYKAKYKDLPINTGKFKKLGVYTDILKPVYDQLHSLLTHHSRISVFAFNLHLPVTYISGPSSSNQLVTEFFKQIKEQLAKSQWQNHKKAIHLWVREVGETEKGHYHCFIGLKQTMLRPGGIKDDGYTGIWKLLQSHWKELSGGYVTPTKYHTVNRGNLIELGEAFKHLSYAAKIRDKDFGTGETHKRFSTSRVRPKDSRAPSPVADYEQEPIQDILVA